MKITELQKALIHEGVDQGKTAKQIAEDQDLSQSVVGYHASRYRKSQQQTDETEEEVQEESNDAVADLYERMLEMKDAHISSLERVIQQITAPR